MASNKINTKEITKQVLIRESGIELPQQFNSVASLLQMAYYPFSFIWKEPATWLEQWEKSGWDEEKVIEDLARDMAKGFDSTQKYQIIYENKKLFDEMIYKCERAYNLIEDNEENKTPSPQQVEVIKVTPDLEESKEEVPKIGSSISWSGLE